MITNFKNLEHLEYHAGKSSAYEKMIMAENILVNASTRTEYIEAIGSMRGVLEQILKEVLPAIGVTDAMILAAKPGSTKIGLLERTCAIQEYMFENGTGVTDMFAMNYIRKVGNEAMHGGDKEPFAGHSLAEVKQAAVMVYEYLFDMVNDIDMEFYLQENIIARRKAAQRQSSPASQKAGKPADKRGWGTWFK